MIEISYPVIFVIGAVVSSIAGFIVGSLMVVSVWQKYESQTVFKRQLFHQGVLYRLTPIIEEKKNG